MEKQTTLQSNTTLSGPGLHTGKFVTATLCPAAENSGIVFRRTDLSPAIEIAALADKVSDTARGTTLCHEGAKIATLEHLMAALHALGVDNVLVEIDGEEVPILDGSARPWVEAIKKAGIKTLDAEREYYKITETIVAGSPDATWYKAEPADDFQVKAYIEFPSQAIGKQEAELTSFEGFENEIAPCRTFVFLHEIAPLLENNLIKGGALDNALVFVDHALEPAQAEKLAKIYNTDPSSLRVNNGVLNTVEPYFPNEPARHKLLDFVGDILLTGVRLKGHFIIKCPGHKANTMFANMILGMIKTQNNIQYID